LQRIFNISGLLLTALLLAACNGSDGQVSQSAPTSVLATTSLKTVSVAVAKDARVNKLPRLDNADTTQTAAQVLAHVNQTLKTELPQQFKGTSPVTVNVSIVSIDMSSGAGRALGSASFLTANVVVVDTMSGKTIKSGLVHTEQKPFRATGNIGIIVMLASNAGSTKAKRYEELAAEFKSDLTLWLNQ
jgi:hypothetical protein